MTKYYGITCVGCEARKKHTDEHLIRNNIAVKWLRGLSGERSGVTTLNPYNYHDPNSSEVISSGHVSLCINHWFTWQRAVDDGCDIAVIFEDDCRVVNDFSERLEKAIESLEDLDKDWDLLYAGHWEGSSHPDFKGQCYDMVNSPVAALKCSPFGLHCYAVKARYLREMLDDCERIYAPIDVAVWVSTKSPKKHYACVPPLAWQEVDHVDYRDSLSYSKHKAHFSET